MLDLDLLNSLLDVNQMKQRVKPKKWSDKQNVIKMHYTNRQKGKNGATMGEDFNS
jgi:hypothetical protein